MQINLKDLNKKIINSPEVRAKAREIAEDIVNKQKQELIREFNSHPVTQEIESGPTATNQSATLAGRGNLFSFIGFKESADPVTPVKKLLNTIRLSPAAEKISGNTIEYKVNMPSNEDFESASKMPWESGRSWLFDIEKSISGLGQYLYGKFKNSRSGTGAQSVKNISPATFRPVKYFGTMLEKFKNKLNGV